MFIKSGAMSRDCSVAVVVSRWVDSPQGAKMKGGESKVCDCRVGFNRRAKQVDPKQNNKIRIDQGFSVR